MLNKNLTRFVVLLVAIAMTTSIFASASLQSQQINKKSFAVKNADYTFYATPNPFEDFTIITVVSNGVSYGTITIKDSEDVVLRNLYEGLFHSGVNNIVWDGTDENSVRLEEGKYICELITGQNYTSKTIILILK